MSDLLANIAAVQTFLKSVPDVVWSGIVGSLITVVGVLATNVGLSRRHREQLKHAATESALQRSHDASESALQLVAGFFQLVKLAESPMGRGFQSPSSDRLECR